MNFGLKIVLRRSVKDQTAFMQHHDARRQASYLFRPVGSKKDGFPANPSYRVSSVILCPSGPKPSPLDSSASSAAARTGSTPSRPASAIKAAP